MKAFNFFFATCSLMAALLLTTTSCNESVDLPELPTAEEPSLEKTDLDQARVYSPDDAHAQDIFVETTNCFAGGMSIIITTTSSNGFRFFWEVNGNNGSQDNKIECACGSFAKVKIIDYNDDFIDYLKFDLPVCEDISGQ